MRIAAALRDLFGSATQTAIAERLSAAGMVVDQTKVSAWLRGRVPNIEQMNDIEDCYGVPHGTVLALAGFIDVPALAARSGAMKPALRLAADAQGSAPKKTGRRTNRPQPPPEE